MTEAKLTVTIDRPLEDVFAVLSDVTKTPRWSAPAVEEEMITPPPVGVGSRRRAVGRAYGVRTENIAEVTEFEPGRAITLSSISGPLPFRVSMAFHRLAGGTRVDWTWAFMPRGLLRIGGPLVAAIFRREFAKDLRRLKSMMESGEL